MPKCTVLEKLGLNPLVLSLVQSWNLCVKVENQGARKTLWLCGGWETDCWMFHNFFYLRPMGPPGPDGFLPATWPLFMCGILRTGCPGWQSSLPKHITPSLWLWCAEVSPQCSARKHFLSGFLLWTIWQYSNRAFGEGTAARFSPRIWYY